MTDGDSCPPMQLVLWSQPADTLLPDIYSFQRRLLDPVEDRAERMAIAREISRFTADPPARQMPLGSASWVMRWQDRLWETNNVAIDSPAGQMLRGSGRWVTRMQNRPRRIPVFRALADLRTTPLRDEMAPNAITIYVLFDVASSAPRVCAEAGERLRAFAGATGQDIPAGVMDYLLAAVGRTADYQRRIGPIGRLSNPPESGSRHDVRHLGEQTQPGTWEPE